MIDLNKRVDYLFIYNKGEYYFFVKAEQYAQTSIDPRVTAGCFRIGAT